MLTPQPFSNAHQGAGTNPMVEHVLRAEIIPRLKGIDTDAPTNGRGLFPASISGAGTKNCTTRSRTLHVMESLINEEMTLLRSRRQDAETVDGSKSPSFQSPGSKNTFRSLTQRTHRIAATVRHWESPHGDHVWKRMMPKTPRLRYIHCSRYNHWTRSQRRQPPSW
ncbi:hypothetical protein BDV24DRAFT_130728 [Aspergillus arachidicola]|uniref:Uncharacterized protein n=1 Tax=Aspergillus arachidicola TaxID=656916 RepID=A0A5N6YCY2_9EURO|nr:hypothetical protein BDV24DRAFT_130728 [Aspergillus arachidicola]